MKGGVQLVVAAEHLVQPAPLEHLLEHPPVGQVLVVAAVDEVAQLGDVKAAAALAEAAENPQEGEQRAKTPKSAVQVSDNDPGQVRRQRLQERQHRPTGVEN